MANRLVPAALPLPVLTDAQTQGGAKCRADILAILAGRQRWLNEFTDGEVADGNERCAPLTGAGGTVGHDHGGLGVSLGHTYFSATFGYGPTSPLTNAEHGEAVRTAVSSGAPGPANLGSSRVLYMGDIRLVWVPPASAVNGPYARAAFSARLLSSAACDIDFDVVNTTSGGRISWSQSISTSIVECLSSSSDAMLDMKPGMFNTIRVLITVNYDAADATVALLSMGLHNPS